MVQEEGDAVHVLMTWLKTVALPNMLRMLVTAPVFQVLMSWLKAAAFWNMLFMIVTFDVSAQLSGLAPVFPVSPLLKAFPVTLPGVPPNMPYMSVTAPVLHALTSWLKRAASLNLANERSA